MEAKLRQCWRAIMKKQNSTITDGQKLFFLMLVCNPLHVIVFSVIQLSQRCQHRTASYGTVPRISGMGGVH